MREPWHVRVRGPLAEYALGFDDHVVGLGYAPASVVASRRLLSDLSGWLDEGGFGLEALVGDELDVFLDDRRRAKRGFDPLRVDVMKRWREVVGPGPDAQCAAVANSRR